MNLRDILKKYDLERFVKEIFILECTDTKKKSLLPFFADGYPGIMFQQATNGAFLYPKMKKLSDFFLYGQTIKPIEISVEGTYRLIVFQLYPFVSKMLFNVNPKTLNDECYDLTSVKGANAKQVIDKLIIKKKVETQVNLIAVFLSELVMTKESSDAHLIPLAINFIISNKGNITVKELTEKFHVTERTLQRQFKEHIGISPKQFAKIVQFDSSLTQLSRKDFTKLTEIVYQNGYADQSHFIRNFKKYTGKNPSRLKSKE